MFRIASALLIAMLAPAVQTTLAAEWGERHCDFAKPETAAQLELFGGAKLADGLLVCDGARAGATLRDSGDFNYTNRGLSVAGVIRMDSKAPSANDMMMVFKPKGWFFGRTGNAGNLSFSTAGRSWDEAVFGGEFPTRGGWIHFAVVLESIGQREQGQYGFKGTVYLNGEPAAQRVFQNELPAQNDQRVMIGNGGLPGYGFKGAIARLDFFQRALKPAEVMKLAQSSPRVKIARPGWFEPNRADVEKLTKLEEAAHSAEQRWLVRMLRRAEDFGADSGRMAAVIEAAASLLLPEDRSAAALVERWNRSQAEFTLVESKEAMLLMARAGGERMPPVLGMFNRATGREVCADRPITWTLRSEMEELSDYVPGASFTITDVAPGADGVDFTVTWKLRKLKVVSRVAFHGPRLAFDLAVENGEPQLRLVEVVFPKVALAKLPGRNDELVFPGCSGTIVRNPTAGAHFSETWPSLEATMQFVGYFDSDRHGVYLALEDAQPVEKHITVLGKNETIVGEYATRVGWKAGTTGGNGFRTTGPAVVELYRGDWFEAGQVYKRFLLAKAAWYPKTLPRTSTPQWYRDQTVWCIDGEDYFGEYLQLPFGVNGSGWFTVDSGPLPVLRAIPQYVEAAKRRHKLGFRVKMYTNARLWGYRPSEDKSLDRSNTPEALAVAARREDGKPWQEHFGVDFNVVCPVCKLWQEVYFRTCTEMANAGFDALYHDQLPCCPPRPCFNPDHGHLVNEPGIWVKGYGEALRRVREAYPFLAHDGEDASECYANILDGFMTWRFVNPNHVPLFQSLYGGGRCQFTGRASDAHGRHGDYDSYFAKMGEQFVYSEQLGWFHEWDFRHAWPYRRYTKKLAHLRYALRDYFNTSDMLRPLDFKTPPPKLRCRWAGLGVNVVETDKVLHCVWRHVDGRIMIVFLNTVDEPIAVEPVVPFAGKVAVCREGCDKVDYLTPGSRPPTVALGPYQAQVWFVAGDYDRQGAEALAPVMKRVASFDDGEPWLLKPDFTVRRELSAVPGKWLRVRDSSWQLLAFTEVGTTLGQGNRQNDSEEIRGRWANAKAGAAIYYGHVDFGEGKGNFAEIQVAVSPADAGGKVKLVNISGNGEPEETIAEFTLAPTGGWFTFKTFKTSLKSRFQGKHDIVVSFEKPCRFRGWRVVE